MERSSTHLLVYRPWQWVAALAALLLLIGLGSWRLYQLGQRTAGDELVTLRDERAAQEQQIRAAGARQRELEERIAVLERAAQIDSVAYGELKTNLAEAQDELQQLQEELGFYRSIVSPSTTRSSLRIRSFDVTPAAEPQRFDYLLLLSRGAAKDRQTYGEVTLQVQGTENGEERILSHEEAVGKSKLAFRFRYFQDLEGTLQIPEGFQPASVTVHVQVDGKEKVELERVFEWPL